MESQILQGLITSKDLSRRCELHGVSGTYHMYRTQEASRAGAHLTVIMAVFVSV